MQQPKGAPSGELSPQATEGGRPASRPKFYYVTDRNGDLLHLTPEGLARWNALGQPPLFPEKSSPQKQTVLPSDAIIQSNVSRRRYDFYFSRCCAEMPFEDFCEGKTNPYNGHLVSDLPEYYLYIGQRAFHLAYDEQEQENISNIEESYRDLLNKQYDKMSRERFVAVNKAVKETTDALNEKFKKDRRFSIAVTAILTVVATFFLAFCYVSLCS